jgi:hypothetical protein
VRLNEASCKLSQEFLVKPGSQFRMLKEVDELVSICMILLVGLGRTELDRHVHLRGCDECLRSFARKNKCTHVNLPGACLHEQHSMNRMIADEMQEIATRFTELQPVSRRSEDSAMTELSSPESVAQIFPAHVFYLGQSPTPPIFSIAS